MTYPCDGCMHSGKCQYESDVKDSMDDVSALTEGSMWPEVLKVWGSCSMKDFDAVKFGREVFGDCCL